MIASLDRKSGAFVRQTFVAAGIEEEEEDGDGPLTENSRNWLVKLVARRDCVACAARTGELVLLLTCRLFGVLPSQKRIVWLSNVNYKELVDA